MDLVAQGGGGFEFEVFGGFEHLFAQGGDVGVDGGIFQRGGHDGAWFATAFGGGRVFIRPVHLDLG